MLEGVGLAAAVAARCGRWRVDTHCASAAVVQFACTDQKTVCVTVWMAKGRLVYCATLARRLHILERIKTQAVPKSHEHESIAARIFGIVHRIFGVTRLAPEAPIMTDWFPTSSTMIRIAADIASRRTKRVITAVFGTETWVLFCLNRPALVVDISPSDIRVGKELCVVFEGATFHKSRPQPWSGNPDVVGYIARLVTVFTAHFRL